MGVSRQEYWSGLPLPSPRELLGDPESSIKLRQAPVTPREKGGFSWEMLRCFLGTQYNFEKDELDTGTAARAGAGNESTVF